MIADIQKIRSYLLNFQRQVCAMAEAEDGQVKFKSDPWQHINGGGGGDSRVLQSGAVFEQAGVNFSHIKGARLPEAATLKRPDLVDCQFQALGVSLVLHPLNPYVPTTHANIRLFVAEKPNGETIWWMGGGFDLTPYYGFKEDCQHWHQMSYQACQPFGEEVYPRYKKWCDDYFYLKHRKEPRGIGGLFFDDLNEWGFEKCFEFLQSVGEHFIKAYQPIVAKRKSSHFGERERNFQLYRRGRYVEFNLLYDRGTLFGIQSGGRTESILMSLPPQVSWRYNWQPEPGTEEARLYTDFLQPKDWLNEP